ncbi:2TM domain-containing protein [Tenacibaculum tangerinum]|uniref:2TM domain-containing protein n=1 Tax=Tenacibaculum tangerinum TaxID=3038772 RepID=A0ABY8L304_9FLAO|nr:2TM domain-containing protein [Tenacibaculum tangerinum]WGH75818.1 2TM domain-containing protein [Tenacibaculum tangerinum]
MKTSSKKIVENLKKDIWICTKLTIIFGIVFILFNQAFTIKKASLVFLFSAMYSFVLGLGNGIINDYLSEKWDWVSQTNQRVWAGIIATISYTVVAVLLIHYVQYIVIYNNNPANFFKGHFLWIHLFAIIFSLGVAVFFHARGFMVNWKASVKQETTQHEIVAKTETAKFETLKSQIDPHFLFNSLNVLTSLISENPKQAEKFTTKLSKVYRYVLEQRNKELVPIQEELQFAKTYMELLQMRFEEAIRFTIPDEVSNAELKIVPLSLQLLLENAVKHNVVSSMKPLEITIFEADGFLQIQNNVNPKEAIGKGTKVGLRNIADRYGLITDRNIEIINNNRTFTVRLPLLTHVKNRIMNTQNLENSKYVKAVERVEKLKEFYQNLISYCLVIPFLIFINLKTYARFQWFWFPMIGWGIGLIFHYLEVHNYNLFLGKNWEERKIKELMKEEEKYK